MRQVQAERVSGEAVSHQARLRDFLIQSGGVWPSLGKRQNELRAKAFSPRKNARPLGTFAHLRSILCPNSGVIQRYGDCQTDSHPSVLGKAEEALGGPSGSPTSSADFFRAGCSGCTRLFYGRCFYRAILLSTARPLVSSSSLSQDINTVTGFSFAATGVVRIRESSAATSGAA